MFDKERSDAGRRSAAEAPRRGEPKANQSFLTRLREQGKIKITMNEV
jgi:hypothetical protein